MKAHPTDRFTNGFTLIEVTLAMAIVSVVIVPLFAVLALSLRTNGAADNRFAAANIVSNISADLRQSTRFTGPVVAVDRESDGKLKFWSHVSGQLDGESIFVGYDSTGTPTGELKKSEGEDPSIFAGDLSFVANIEFQALSDEENPVTTGQKMAAKLVKVKVTVFSPAAESSFSTFIHTSDQNLLADSNHGGDS